MSFHRSVSTARHLPSVFQGYADWKKGIPTVGLPAVCINSMDHLTSYVQEVTDATQKLCGLIRSTYMKTFTLAWKPGESVSGLVYPCNQLHMQSVTRSFPQALGFNQRRKQLRSN